MQGAFDEHLKIIAALKDNYGRNDDASSIAHVAEVQREVEAACTAKEEKVAALVKELSQAVTRLEGEAAYPHEEGSHQQAVAQLERDTEECKENVNKMNKERTFLEGHLEQLQALERDLQARMDALEEEAKQAEPRTRHELSLYAHISKITWHYEQRERVAGAVSDPVTGDIRVFDLDPAQKSRFDVVNMLWDTLG